MIGKRIEFKADMDAVYMQEYPIGIVVDAFDEIRTNYGASASGPTTISRRKYKVKIKSQHGRDILLDIYDHQLVSVLD